MNEANQKQANAAPRVRPFTDVLRDLRYGELHQELSDKLNELVAAVASTGKGGELTLKIKLKPSGGSALEVTDDVALKLPQLPKGASVMFTTKDFNLTRQDERQLELGGLRVAGGTENAGGNVQGLKEASQ